MSFTFADFKQRFPELASVDENFYNTAKSSAELRVDLNVWGSKSDEGIKLLTAHIISLSDISGSFGQLKRSKVGDLEREYSGISDLYGPVTIYYTEFCRLKSTLLISPFFIC